MDLRNSLLSLLVRYRSGSRPIRTQLCVCLAGLALQLLEWKDVIGLVVSTLGNDVESSICLLEFLRVLPEEVTEGRKVSLTVCIGGSNWLDTYQKWHVLTKALRRRSLS